MLAIHFPPTHPERTFTFVGVLSSGGSAGRALPAEGRLLPHLRREKKGGWGGDVVPGLSPDVCLSFWSAFCFAVVSSILTLIAEQEFDPCQRVLLPSTARSPNRESRNFLLTTKNMISPSKKEKPKEKLIHMYFYCNPS